MSKTTHLELSPEGVFMQVTREVKYAQNQKEILKLLVKEGPDAVDTGYTTIYDPLGITLVEKAGTPGRAWACLPINHLMIKTRNYWTDNGDGTISPRTLREYEEDGEGDVKMDDPVMFNIPDDLIVYFVLSVKNRSGMSSLINPTAADAAKVLDIFEGGDYRCGLVAFSKSLNRSVELPLPNVFDSLDLCAGDSTFDANFRRTALSVSSHSLRAAVPLFHRAWENTVWNLDLLEGSFKNDCYPEFIRFKREGMEQCAYPGASDWETASSSNYPLEQIFAPFVK